MLTLAAARAKVRNRIDDTNTGGDARWSDDEIDEALLLARDIVVDEAISAGVHQPLRQTQTISLSGGIAALPPNRKIISVFLQQGTTLIPIRPIPPRNRNISPVSLSGSLLIDYIAQPEDPADEDGYLLFAPSTPHNRVWDAYTVALAAQELLLKDGEPAPDLLASTERLSQSFRRTPTTGAFQLFSPESLLRGHFEYHYHLRDPGTIEVIR